MIREIDGGGSSHISQNSTIAHFGLGNASKIDKITVYWTGGNKQIVSSSGINQVITITEIPAKKPDHPLIYLLAGLVFATIILIVWKKRKKK